MTESRTAESRPSTPPGDRALGLIDRKLILGYALAALLIIGVGIFTARSASTALRINARTNASRTLVLNALASGQADANAGNREINRARSAEWARLAQERDRALRDTIYGASALLASTALLLLAGTIWVRHERSNRFEALSMLEQVNASLEARVVDRTFELAMANSELAVTYDSLQRVNAELEDRVQERTADLAAVNEHLSQQARALAEARDKAVEASRTKSDFVARMSHEIRTPMNGVTGMTRLLLDTPLNERQATYVRTIRSCTDALLSVINDILDFSKLEAGHMAIEVVDFDLPTLLEQVVQLFSAQAAQKQLDLHSDIPASTPPYLRGDAGRIRQIITNLVANALKFTREGSVIVEARVECETAEDVSLALTVRDTGIGIPAHRREAIFESFTQADGSTAHTFGGTGLGLTISRQLAEFMGGTLTVESVEGEGSAFHLRITLQKQLQSDARAAEQPIAADPDSPLNLRVLVAEDNSVNQRVAQWSLEKWGCLVDCVGSGVEALAALAPTDYDVILMDVQMPYLDGLQTTRAIREQERGTKQHIKIIALTSNVLDEHRKACMEAGMDDYVAKPIDFPSLHGKLRAIAAELNLLDLSHPRKAPEQRFDYTIPALQKGNSVQLDLPTLRRNCVDDRDLIHGVLGEVLRVTPARIDRLTTAAKNDDASTVHGEAHRMKGSFKTIGALALGEICEHIETATERGEMSLLQSDFHALQTGYADLVQEIESFLAVGEAA